MPIKWFKVLLDKVNMQEGLRTDPILDLTRRSLEEMGKTPVDAVADYLRCLWKFTRKQIDATLEEDLEKNYQFRFIITVPAI